MPETQDEGRGLAEVLRELAESSSVHGIPKIASSRQRSVKLLWCLLSLATACLMAYQLTDLINEFRSNPVITRVKLGFSQLRYPDVTLCNMNPIRKSKINDAPELKAVIFKQKKKPSSTTKSVSTDMRKPTDEIKSEDEVKAASTNGGSRRRRQADFVDDVTSASDNYTENSQEDNVTARNSGWDLLGIGESLDTDNTTNKQDDLADISPVLGNLSNETSVTNSSDEEYDDYYYDDYYDYFYDDDYNMTGGDTTWHEYSDFHDDLDDELRDDLVTSPREAWSRQSDTIKAEIKKSQKSIIENVGHQKEDVVIAFSYAGMKQNVKDIQQFTSSTYGNCFKISSKKYKAWRSGPDHGMKLVLNLEQSEYVSEFASGVGLRLAFNEPGSLPMPSEEGITISGGFDTSIGLKTVRILRLGEPYGHCSDGEQFYKQYGRKYSVAACMEFCRVQQVINQCGCVPSNSPEMFTTQKGVDVCRVIPDPDAMCELMVDLAMDKKDTVCDCPSACSETVYEKGLSGRFWPTEDYLSKALMREVCSKKIASMATACQQQKNGTFDPSKFVKNFLTLRIYFEDLNYESIEEAPMYEPVRFISDVGGTLGLFMGVSMLSLVEVLQLLLELGLYCSRRLNPRQHDHEKAANPMI